MATKKKFLEAAAGLTRVDKGDPNFANVVLLLDGDGSSLDNNNTYTDSALEGTSGALPITENGIVKQGSFSPYGDNWSNYFDSNYLYAPSSANFNLSSGNWTIEGWLYTIDTSYGERYVVLEGSSQNYGLIRGNNNTVEWNFFGTSALITSSTNSVLPNTWVHFAVVSNSGTITLYIDGVSQGTTTTYPQNSNTQVTLAASVLRYVSTSTNTYISNLRIVKGTAIYTSAFTPPTDPLTAVTNTQLLTCSSNRFADESTNNSTLTISGTPRVTSFSPFKDSSARTLSANGGSAYIDNSTITESYLRATDNIAFDIGTGDYTYELWVYVKTINGSFIMFGATVGANSYFGYYDNNNSRLSIYDGSNVFYSGNDGAINLYSWNHIVFQRESGSTTTMYLNGTQVYSTSSTHNWSTAITAFDVGHSGSYNNYEMDGYVADVRFARAAVYTGSPATITVPTAPISANSNTELMLSFHDAGIFDRAGVTNLSTEGDAALALSLGTGTMSFDGTGDYLVLPYQEYQNLNGVDFTIEFWAYPAALGSYNGIVSYWSTGNSWLIETVGTDMRFYTSGGAYISMGTATVGKWNHWAVTVEGTVVKTFRDGVQVNFATVGTIPNVSTNDMYVGAVWDASVSTAGQWNGYINDLRITKGVARYTQVFDPPISPIDLSTDEYAKNVTLLLDGDGPANGQNNTFTDSSSNNLTVTKNGQVTQGVFSPYGEYWSVYLDGTGDYLDVGSSGVTNIGSGDFTVEFWISTIDSSFNIFNPVSGTGAGYWGLIVQSGDLRWNNAYASTNLWVVDGASIIDGHWHHVAVVRSSGTHAVYYDGVAQSLQSGSFSDTTNYSGSAGLRIGNGNLDELKGYLSNVRVVAGTAIYTSNFTPPTEPFTSSASYTEKAIVCQSNRFIDNGDNSNAITISGNTIISRYSPFGGGKPYDFAADGGSAYFDDTAANQYLQIADNSVFDATSSLCIEAWFYMTSAPGDGPNAHAIVNKWVSTTPGQRTIFIDIESTGLRVYADIQNSLNPVLITTDGGAISQHAWHHVAVTWDGSTYRAFLDGVLEGSTSNSNAPVASSQPVRVAYNTNTHWFGGYISDVRWVTDGGAIYTSDFTPPTAPLTAVTNTSLLLSFQDSAIPDKSGLSNVNTVDGAKIITLTSPAKYGNNSMQFGGTTDRLITLGPDLLLGTGDLTIEFWVYFNSVSDGNIYTILDGRTTSDTTNVMWAQEASGSWTIFNGAGAGLASGWGSSTFTTGVWYHVAQTRSNGVSRFFKNGTQTSGNLSDPSDYNSSTYSIGGRYSPSAYSLDGYIDDFRITKGLARYTSNFTPPTEALPKF
jgi:hypothetical protein